MTDEIENPKTLNAGLLAALAKAQSKLGGAVTKDSTNPHFRNQYASLAAVLRAAIPALTSEGIALVQYREASELVTVLGHVDGGLLEVRYPLHPMKQDPQGWGSAMTYARRYQLMALLGLAADDDDGNAASGWSGGPQQPPQPRKKAAPKKAAPKKVTRQKATEEGSEQWVDRAVQHIQAAANVLSADDLASVLGCELADIDEAISRENLLSIGREHSRTLLEQLRQTANDVIGGQS